MLTERLKMLRDKACKSQKEAAAEIGIPYHTLTLYEIGKMNPSPKRIRQLADYYGVSTNFLLGKEETQEPRDLSVEENLLLAKFAKLTKDGKLQIMAQIDFLLYGGIPINNGANTLQS